MEFLVQLTDWTGKISGWLWDLPAAIILVGTGLFLTYYLGFIQIRGFKHAIGLISGRYDKPEDKGEVSHFQALSTALSATIGTGNISGVATAIVMGGPGAIVWMWLTAFIGMATKFASCTLAVKFRQIDNKGQIAGGPMYTLLHGLNMPKLGAAFAFFAVIASFGIGNMVQANSVVDGLQYLSSDLTKMPITTRAMLGCLLASLVGLVIVGGVKRIAKIASIIVPFMAAGYCLAAMAIIIMNYSLIPEAFSTIISMAFNPQSVGGGAAGFTVMQAMRYGVARGVFSNEAGLGSAAMAHAAAKTNEPVREGLVAMLGPFIDTIVVCTMTALVIIITGSWGANTHGFNGAALSAFAFESGLTSIAPEWGKYGAWVVGIGLIFFAYSTMIAWSYYGDRCALFLFGDKAVLPYRILFILLIIVGATIPLELAWNLADITNIFMAVPNLISLVLLSVLVKKLSADYFAKPHN